MALIRKLFELAPLVVLCVSCGNSSTGESSLAPLKAGSFLSECFLNRLATLNAGIDLYTVATFDIADDGNGSNTYQLYSDPICTMALSGEGTSGTIPVQFSIIKMYGDAFVLKFVQDTGGGNTQTLYIGGTYVDDKYNLDIDYGANPNAGPFLEGQDSVPPSQETLQPFINNPELGTLFNPS